jgi:hypothetical protein
MTALTGQVAQLRAQVLAALGSTPVDLVLRDCRVVNVHAEDVHPADIAILSGRIVAVRESFTGPADTEVDCAGRTVIPGLVQPRVDVHPADGLRNGTTTYFSTTRGSATGTAEPDGRIFRAGQRTGADQPATLDLPASPTVTELDEPAALRGLLRAGEMVAVDTRSISDRRVLGELSGAGLDTRFVCLTGHAGRVDLGLTDALRAGVQPIRAVQLAALNAATHLGVSHEVGSVTPGRWADLVVLRELGDFPPESVYLDGRLVARRGEPVT